ARRTPLVERGWRWCRRNPRLAGLTALVGLLVLVILVGTPVLLVRLWEQRGRAEENLTRAEEANPERIEELWTARLARAEGLRPTNQAGRRSEGLAALDEARGLLPRLRPDPQRALDLRNQVIACLALPDLGISRRWDGYPPGTAGVALDAR